jgi:hypothetical protein
MQYGSSVRLGQRHIRQSLPRLLTLYFEFGSKMAATKAVSQRLKVAQQQVRGRVAGAASVCVCVCVCVCVRVCVRVHTCAQAL